MEDKDRRLSFIRRYIQELHPMYVSSERLPQERCCSRCNERSIHARWEGPNPLEVRSGKKKEDKRRREGKKKGMGGVVEAASWAEKEGASKGEWIW